MNKPYVIKNCPAYNDDEDFSCRNEAIEPLLCQDCTDCVMKQIVELCRDGIEECSCKNPNPDIDCFECTSGGRANIANEYQKDKTKLENKELLEEE